MKPKSIRYTLWLEPAQLRLLDAERAHTGATRAEVVRRAISYYMSKAARKGHRHERSEHAA